MPDSRPERAQRAFFGRRKGHKLRPRQADLLETLLPRLAFDVGAAAPADLRTLFPGAVRAVALEIGFGGGEHLVHEASTQPDIGFLGCEPFVNGMASALARIEAAGLSNIRLYHGDAIDVLDWLPDRSIARVDLLFPDPWPKRRHWKRRFISEVMVEKLARLTARGGTFRFATDVAGYAEWTLLHMSRSGAFAWTAERADDWRQPWPGHAPTRYEQKAVRAGRKPCYLVFRRV